jgi:uncharacterized membrane protein (UPF0136 family)
MPPESALLQPASRPHLLTVITGQTGGFHIVRRLMDSWFGAILGGGVYGAWAVWANWEMGAAHAWGIGLAHWATSALLTFFGTMAMRRFYGNARGWAGGLRAFAGGLGLTYTTLFAVHGAIGTQNLLLTLAPGIGPNVVFCTTYALLLMRTQTIPVPP